MDGNRVQRKTLGPGLFFFIDINGRVGASAFVVFLATLAQGGGYGAAVEAVLNTVIPLALQGLFDIAYGAARPAFSQLISTL